ncbi:MAG: hypothetical protein M0036_17780 [Desulfobacteraceae bacterium]|nr:hypothetical protein [Desulfobacteraceae bacterium]
MLKIFDLIDPIQYTRVWQALYRRPRAALAIFAAVSCLALLAPYIVRNDTETVYRYWDGPNYAYLAKTLYFVPAQHPLSPYSQPEYFAAHLPIYPLSIKLLSLTGLSYNAAMLAATILYTIGATLVLFQLLSETRLVQSPFWSALIALFIPARYLIYHSVGATEAPFIFFTLYSLLCYLRGQYITAFILGGISGITRITGVLIGIVYLLQLIYERKYKLILWLPIIGLPLLATFVFYYFHYGDFFAYFGVNLSNKNSLLHAIPIDIFRLYCNVGEAQTAEFFLVMYAAYGAGVCLLWSKNKLLFFYSLVIFVFSLFLFHQDISRYLIPLAPLALVTAYDSILSNRIVKWAMVFYVGLSYIYAWGMIPHNLCVDWVYNNLLLDLQAK